MSIKSGILTPSFGPIGYITHKLIYARRLESETRTESFHESVMRILDGAQNQLNVGFTDEELDFAYQAFMKFKCSVGGRFLWQLGTETVDRLGVMSLQNCAFVNIDDPIRPFTWIFDVLMLGTGVGFNIQKHNIDKLPAVIDADVKITRCDTNDADYLIPDSREGWVNLLKRVLTAHFYKGKGFSYSTVCIRKLGTPIKGFGGIASGPEQLVKGIENVCSILSKRRGAKLSSVDCLDLVNIIAQVVVSGNVRRSALIALGDCDDVEYLNAKRWDLGNIPNWRCMSNNSVICNDISQLPSSFWEGYNGNGEPYGLINLDLCKNVGRIKDGTKYADPSVAGVNPCGEIPLANFETCCLGEIYLCNIDSMIELVNVATMIYRICKHSLMLKCHHSETDSIIHKNFKIGIGITGYMQATEQQKGWLDSLYTILRTYDIMYSKKHNVPVSVKLTTIKPSGTLSLLAGTTPGIHPGIFKYFIRRIRVRTTNEQLIKLCQAHGYRTEYARKFDGTNDLETMIVEFPCKYSEHTRLAKDMSAVDQLEALKTLQTDWSDNSVSITVYYRLHELDSIKKWLSENYNHSVKSCSFLLHNDHGFDQAPYEEITKEQFEQLSLNVMPITEGSIMNDSDTSIDECEGGACPAK